MQDKLKRIKMETKEGPSRHFVFNYLMEDIVHERINAGKKLLESELAENFGVSRTPIREALIQIEA